MLKTRTMQHPAITDIWFRVVLIFAMSLPMLVLYATSTLGPLLGSDLRFGPASLGYLVMSSFGVAAVLSLWAGAFVDRIGSRNALIVLFSTIASAFTWIASVESYYGLIGATALCGIAQALANPVTNLLIAQQVPPAKKAKIVGLKQSGVQLAALFAGLVLPGIAFEYGWRTAFAMVVPVAILFALTAPFVTPKTHPGTGRGFTFFPPNSFLLRLMGIQFCVGVSLSAFVTFLPTFAIQHGMPLSLAGTLIAVLGVMGMCSRIVLTPMGAKFKDESLLLLLLIAIAACSMGVMMLTDAENHWRLWVGAVGVGLTAVGTNAIAMSMLIRDAAFGPVTVASGFVSVAFFGGFALGPPFFGAISNYSGANYSGDPLFGWTALIGVLLSACMMSSALASARRRARASLMAADAMQPTNVVAFKRTPE
ncbi:CynX/NimT family MFS transporter [Nitrosovibrio tenuis]|uniref:Predicted arabinose efflux permease, MFS family n=1 Tax=Nitrosovibrio tenuis TaxID=1233 RepID=A0A1H7PZ69_9PROT|nr:MFS transporter [Nitrosovibrio tenuis]SEL40768.1 Predicted arabinose efflux permease, MFS family [Nitrosovibrio tenuis]